MDFVMLSLEEQKAIVTSFNLVKSNSQTFTQVFYKELFRRAPETRAMFQEDMASQREKLFKTIAAAVSYVGNYPELVPTIQKLGYSHKGYGAMPQHYGIVAEALLKAFREVLGLRFTNDMHQAWLKLYSEMAKDMMVAQQQVV